MKTKIIKIAKTRNSIPALWESIKAGENGLIRSTIICTIKGILKNAVFINKNNEKQALVPIKVGDLIIKAYKEGDDKIGVSVLRIVNIDLEKSTAKVELILRKEPNEDSFPSSNYFFIYNDISTLIAQAINKVENPSLENILSKLSEKIKLEKHEY